MLVLVIAGSQTSISSSGRTAVLCNGVPTFLANASSLLRYTDSVDSDVSYNALTMLPEGTFQGLDALLSL